MQDKLQKITDKIYREGVSRGNEEAEKIISGARDEAAKIIANAKEEAKSIIAEAGQKADELTKKTESELKLSFRQSLNSLKQEIEKNLISGVVDEPVSEIFSDNTFLAHLIEIITEKWSQQDNETGMEILLPQESIAEVEKYLKARTSKILSGKVILRPDKSLEKGFEIHPSGKGYKISVTDQDIAGYLRGFIRPKLAELLFEKDK